jgi:hypothetical protein
MQARRKLSPGQKGTKKFSDRYGDQLVCVRYRYDKERHKRFTTVEIIVEESAWSPPATSTTEPAIVGLRVALNEVNLQRLVKQAGGKWNREKRLWELQLDQALALGLSDRVQPIVVSNSRHQ